MKSWLNTFCLFAIYARHRRSYCVTSKYQRLIRNHAQSRKKDKVDTALEDKTCLGTIILYHCSRC